MDKNELALQLAVAVIKNSPPFNASSKPEKTAKDVAALYNAIVKEINSSCEE